MKTLILIICIILISSCEKEEIKRIQSVDVRVIYYFELFATESLKRNINVRNESYNIIISNDIGLYSGISNKGTYTIKINESYLNYPNYLEFIMFHECGHYFLSLKHDTSLIMTSGLTNDLIKKYLNDKDYYIDELFNVNP